MIDEKKYESLFRQMKLGVVYQDSNGVITDANRAAEEILGYSLSQLRQLTTETSLWDPIREDGSHFPGSEQPAIVALKTGKDVTNEILGIHHPVRNKRVWLRINAVPEFSEQETQPYRVFTTIADITEHFELRLSLKESEERYRTIVNNAPEAIVVFDIEKGQFIDCNTNAEKLYGLEREELLKSNPLDISPPIQANNQASEELVKKYFDEALNGKIVLFEWIHLNKKTNKKIHCEVRLVQLPAKNKKLIRGSIIDLSNIKSAEYRLEQIFDNTQDAILIHDLEGKVLDVNSKMCDMYGLNKSEAVKTTIVDISSPSMDIKDAKVFWERVIDGEKVRFEWKAMRPKDKIVFDVEVSLQKIGYLDNKFILGNIRDISDRKKAEAEIIESNKELQNLSIQLKKSNTELKQAVEDIEKSRARVTSIIENTTDSIWAINRKYEIIYINEVFRSEFLQSFGTELNVGDNLVKSLPEFLVPLWKDRYDRALNNERFTFEDKVEVAPGINIYIQVGMNPILVDGNVIGASFFGSNITKRKEIEEEIIAANEELRATTDALVQSNKELEAALKEARRSKELEKALSELKEAQSQLIQQEKLASLGILTAGVAHEINNPLNYILGGYTGLFNYFKRNEHNEAEKVDILLNSIKTGVDKAATIVRGLNQFSRDQDKFDEECDIHNIIDNCLAMLNNQLKHRIEIRKDLTQTPYTLLGNVGKLHQVFLNVLSNAEQAIEGEGFIAIHTYIENKYIHIDITDSGAGMSPFVLNKITEPFFTTKEPGKGTGLGMSIVNNIIQEHKGTLGYISNENEGATIKIKLPIK